MNRGRRAADLVNDSDEVIGIGILQRLDEHAVDHAENRHCRTDAERERHDCRDREAGLLS